MGFRIVWEGMVIVILDNLFLRICLLVSERWYEKTNVLCFITVNVENNLDVFSLWHVNQVLLHGVLHFQKHPYQITCKCVLNS